MVSPSDEENSYDQSLSTMFRSRILKRDYFRFKRDQ